MAIRVIENRRLSAEENLWLKSLSRDLDAKSMDAVLRKIGDMGKRTLNQVLEDMGLIQEWETRGEARGIQEGRQEGVQTGIRKAIELIKSGMNPDDVLRMYPSEPAQAS